MAKRKYPRSSDKESSSKEGEAYVSWDSNSPKDRDRALAQYSTAVSEFSYASLSSRSRDYSDLTTRLSGKPGLSQSDYDWFRDGERAPVGYKEIIGFARTAYRRIGLIRNAIDLMGDFACQGVRLVHQNPRLERFYNDWFKRVKGRFVSERLCNLLFREANVPIRMKTAKINKRKRLEMQKSFASPDMEAIVKNNNFQKGEIPWQYVFIDPLLLDVVGGAVSNLIGGEKIYAMNIPPSLKRQIRKLQSSHNSGDRAVLEKLPEEVLLAAKDPKGMMLLPPDKTFVYHYKKDDWQEWADPMINASHSDLILYEKLKLADRAALDGAVNKLRVWKLGSLEHKLAPTSTAASALGEILGANVGGGTMDVIWGPDIELIETGTDVQQFLGDEKYKPTLMAIYACLGIPPTLTGTFGASGTTNNFISLKTLTERLNYVRSVILDFWNEQIKIVQNAMGFRFPAQVEFDFMYLDDPASMTQLLIGLADRNIISDEFIQRNVKAQPKIERNRLSNEEKKRKSGNMSEKISPFHSVDKDFALEKIALQTGIVSPSQVGLRLKKRSKDEMAALEMRRPKNNKDNNDVPPEQDENVDVGQPGRPKNSKDNKPRKKREFKPRMKATVELWAREAQDKISNILNPMLLSQLNKKNMRSLTREELSAAEKIKFEILCAFDYGDEIDDIAVARSINQDPISTNIHKECETWISDASKAINKKLSIDERRNLRASFYAYYKENIS